MTDNTFSFFNGDNVFLKCFIELGKKIGKRANGPIGLIFDIVMALIKKESYKKPDLRHWLLYGTKVYEDVKKVDDEFYKFYTNVEDTTPWYKFFESNAEIGYMLKKENEEDEWIGVDEGKKWTDGGSLELEDIKRKIENLHLQIDSAAKDMNKQERIQGMYGIPNLLKSDIYK